MSKVYNEKGVKKSCNFSLEVAVSTKQLGPRLLLITNRKSEMHFQLVIKSMTLDTWNGRYTLNYIICVSQGAQQVKFSSVQPVITPVAFAGVFPVPTFRDIRFRTAGAFESTKIASLCHKQ